MSLRARRAVLFGVAILAAVALTVLLLILVRSPRKTNQLMVVNSASQQGGKVPRGGLLSIVTTDRISNEQARTFYPWTTQAPDGVYVEASCGADGSLKRLPLRYVGWSGGGSRIDVYYPNSTEPEPFGTCADSGPSQFWVHPAPGFGDPVRTDVVTVTAHPGVFAAGDAPDGTHVDGSSGATTPLPTCNQRLPDDPIACRVRTGGKPAKLVLYLTGADTLICEPCVGSPLLFELAPVVGGVVGNYVPQDLEALVRDRTGVEKATVRLRADTAPGEYRLRVRNTQQTEFPPPLRVEFGQPDG